MGQIESGLVGYIAGFMSGSLLIFIVIGLVAFRASEDLKIPTEVNDFVDTIKTEFMDPEREIFLTAFAIGFIMGIGGSKQIVD